MRPSDDVAHPPPPPPPPPPLPPGMPFPPFPTAPPAAQGGWAQVAPPLPSSPHAPSRPPVPAATGPSFAHLENAAANELQENLHNWRLTLNQICSTPWLLAQNDLAIPLDLAGPELFARVQQLRSRQEDEILAAEDSEKEIPEEGSGQMDLQHEEEAVEEDVPVEGPHSPAVEAEEAQDADGGGDDFDLYGDLSMAAIHEEEEVEEEVEKEQEDVADSTRALDSGPSSRPSNEDSSERVESEVEVIHRLRFLQRESVQLPELAKDLRTVRLALISRVARGHALATLLVQDPLAFTGTS